MPLLNKWNATCAVGKSTCPRQPDRIFFYLQGAKKVGFTARHSGKLWLVFTCPKFISTSPKNFLISRIDYTLPSVIWTPQKNFTSPSGKLRTEFTSPIAKSTSPGLSDTTFFARCTLMKTLFHLKINFVLKNTGNIKGRNHHTLLNRFSKWDYLAKAHKEFLQSRTLKATFTLFINTVFYVFWVSGKINDYIDWSFPSK